YKRLPLRFPVRYPRVLLYKDQGKCEEGWRRLPRASGSLLLHGWYKYFDGRGYLGSSSPHGLESKSIDEGEDGSALGVLAWWSVSDMLPRKILYILTQD